MKVLAQGERNLLKMYLHAAGKSEIPTQWHIWSFLTMIAAMLSNNVYYRKFPWQRVYPNLYTFLIGPSGCGKGAAIDFALQFYNPKIFMKTSIATSKNMIDAMSKPTEAYPEPHKILLVQPELADAIGEGTLANQFVKFMTEVYTPSAAGFDEGTRMHGENTMPPPCVNWLAGTTTEWLSECVNEKAMMSGFFGRVAGSLAEYDWNNRVYDPSEHTPDDYQDVLGEIYGRLDYLSDLEGPFKMTSDARAYDEHWYMQRRPPDAGLEAFWRREHDLTLKLAMIFCLLDDPEMIIELKHIKDAQMMVSDVRMSMPKIVRLATSTRQMANLYRIHQFMADQGVDVVVSYRKLVKYANAWNIRTGELNGILYELQMLDVVSVAPRGSDGLDAFSYIGHDKQHRGIEEWEQQANTG